MLFKIFCILIVSAVSFSAVQCHDLNATERIYLRDRALKFSRFFLSQRVDPENPSRKSENSIADFLDTETGRAELKAINQFVMTSFFPVDIESSVLQAYLEYFMEQKDLFRGQFTSHLSLGLVKLWPRYYYDPKNSESPIVVLPEEISLNPSTQDDLGPPILDLANTSTSAPLFENSPKWVSGTPKELQKPDLYELNHVVPLPVITRFYELFSATWNAADIRKRFMLSAPFRLLNSAVSVNLLSDLGDALSHSNANIDQLKSLASGYIVKDVKKYLLWAPGNLFFGFKNQVDKDAMRPGCEMIVGYDRFKVADQIYNRIMDFENRVGNSQKIVSDDSLLTEMTEILSKFVVFGRIDLEPRTANWRHWDKNVVTGKWRLKSKKDFADLYDYQRHVAWITASFDWARDYRSPLVGALSHDCPKLENDKYPAVRSILTNRSDVVNVLREYFKKYPDQKSAKLSDVNEFVSSELVEKNWLWSRVEHLCKLGDRDESVLSCDENSEPVGRKCPQVKMDRHRYVNTSSFSDWCSGRKFENKNQVTLDSAVIRVLTFGTEMSNSLNKKIYYDLYDEYMKESDTAESVDFVGYVNEQMQKFNTTAARILNGACETYNTISTRLVDY